MGGTVEKFFEDIERGSEGGKTLPVWYVFFYSFCEILIHCGRRGELYLEVYYCIYMMHYTVLSSLQFHRGTYTSHGE